MDKGPAPSSSSAASSSTLPATHLCSHALPPHNHHSTCNRTAAAPGQLDTVHRRAALRPGRLLPNQLQLQPPPPHAYTQSPGPYFDLANAQLMQWAYQQRMFNTQQAHSTPPPLPDNAQPPYTAFHPYHRPSYQQSTHSESSGPPPDWAAPAPTAITATATATLPRCAHPITDALVLQCPAPTPLTPLQWLVVVHLLPAAATATTLALVFFLVFASGAHTHRASTVPSPECRMSRDNSPLSLSSLSLVLHPCLCRPCARKCKQKRYEHEQQQHAAEPPAAEKEKPHGEPVQLVAEPASVMIRKLGSMGRLTRHNSLSGIMSLFKDKKPKEGDEDGVGSGRKKDKEKDKDRDRAADAAVANGQHRMHRRTMTLSPEPKPALVFQLRPPMSLTFGLCSSSGSTEDVEECHQVQGLLPVFKRRL
ncbi:hypothetical protein B0H10DRAFT_2209690 [Mycena sp. CBHHK59/15]|nr:hypothetical protein B0H10DRAFT_2209690 [Mycena sp. CBHHK59/15]